ncbi:DUF4097 family beta strand repeat-containing protein [Streptomyces cavernae]|uniref:DUF4097 family beta strand repeat-containing protein n=1 Tax=Streptomyces cavernae TaxID=2259034 RepID=UPI000FEBD611|nr:DUF4097 family beta strand repeat-containing protein [Streptomyces cavernae]
MSEWSVAEPKKLVVDAPVTELHVRIVNGTVNVVGTEGVSARLQVSEIEGPPLVVTHEGGTLTVSYEDLPWPGMLKWLDRKGRRRHVVVSLAVPADTSVEVGMLGAGAMVSGIEGRTQVKGVNGDTTLVGLSGPVRVETVSGNLEAQAVTGDLRFSSVSGDLTVVEGAGSSVKAESVSGSMIVDLDPAGRPTDISLANVSGEIAIRLPHPADAEVEANTASGAVSSAFEDLRVTGQWGAKKITGRLGAGNGKLKATTASGSIALLRRPPTKEEPWDGGAERPTEKPASPGPADSIPGGAMPHDARTQNAGPEEAVSGGEAQHGSSAGNDTASTTAPRDAATDSKDSTEAPTDKKVL